MFLFISIMLPNTPSVPIQFSCHVRWKTEISYHALSLKSHVMLRLSKSIVMICCDLKVDEAVKLSLPYMHVGINLDSLHGLNTENTSSLSKPAQTQFSFLPIWHLSETVTHPSQYKLNTFVFIHRPKSEFRELITVAISPLQCFLSISKTCPQQLRPCSRPMPP